MKKIKKYINCRTIEGKYNKVKTSELFFRPSVYGVLIENGKVLLSKQWDGYDFPGGAIEIDETIEEALTREFWEETGLKVKMGKLIACESSFFITPVSRKKCNSILIYHLVKRGSGKLNIKNIDDLEKGIIDMPEWINIKDFINIKFYNSVDNIKIIKKALKIIN